MIAWQRIISPKKGTNHPIGSPWKVSASQLLNFWNGRTFFSTIYVRRIYPPHSLVELWGFDKLLHVVQNARPSKVYGRVAHREMCSMEYLHSMLCLKSYRNWQERVILSNCLASFNWYITPVWKSRTITIEQFSEFERAQSIWNPSGILSGLACVTVPKLRKPISGFYVSGIGGIG